MSQVHGITGVERRRRWNASTGSGAGSYSYDQEKNLTATSATATLTYDPIDRLETTTGSTTGTTQFLYDGNHIIAEYSGGVVTNRYAFGPGMDEPLVWYVDHQHEPSAGLAGG